MNDLLATLRAAHTALADPVLCDKFCRECDQRRALLAALTEQIAAVERDAWQPIETAPRDGTIVLVANKYYQHTSVYLDCDEVWCVLENDDEITPQPTHWRSLPAHPVSP